MKNSRSSTQLLLFILVFALLAAIGSARQSTDPEVQLRAAIAKEEIAGNLYKQIISKSGKNRPLVAKALFRLGGCYEKQGNAEARRTYEQLIKDYSDQTDVISQARARISASAPDNEMRIRQVWKVNAHTAEDWATPSPDGRNLAYLGTDNELIIRDLASGQDRMVSRLAGNASITSGAYDGLPMASESLIFSVKERFAFSIWLPTHPTWRTPLKNRSIF